jgi:hypothetical protein
MIQLAATVQPTKSAKHQVPNWTIFLGSARCVIPKTIEVKREKRSTELK